MRQTALLHWYRDMQRALDLFEQNLSRVKELGGVHNAISAMTTSVMDISDVLRAQLVLAVSALDHYVHELARIGMLEIFDGLRPPTPSYLRFRLSMDSISANPGQALRAAFETEIRVQHGFLAFQHPDKIADAVRLISTVELWPSVAALSGVTAKDMKERVQLIVDRRNKIAHEADLNPTVPGERWPISAADVADITNFIDSMCHSIHGVVV